MGIKTLILSRDQGMHQMGRKLLELYRRSVIVIKKLSQNLSIGRKNLGRKIGLWVFQLFQRRHGAH